MTFRKKIEWAIISSTLSAVLVAGAAIYPGAIPNASAYGGGGGVPPASLLIPQVNLICVPELITIQLPFNLTRTITIPKCHVEVIEGNNDEFNKRLKDFIDRVIHGDNR